MMPVIVTTILSLMVFSTIYVLFKEFDSAHYNKVRGRLSPDKGIIKLTVYNSKDKYDPVVTKELNFNFDTTSIEYIAKTIGSKIFFTCCKHSPNNSINFDVKIHINGKFTPATKEVLSAVVDATTEWFKKF